MRPAVLECHRRLVAAGVLALATSLAVSFDLPGAELSPISPPLLITNVLQLRSLATQEPEVSYDLQIEGDVWWAKGSTFVLHDASGTETLEADLTGPGPNVGDRIKLLGHATTV